MDDRILDIYIQNKKTIGLQGICDLYIEESAELIKEIIKNRRYKNNKEAIAEEIADVYIVMQQLIIGFDRLEEVQQEVEKKLERTLSKLKLI